MADILDNACLVPATDSGRFLIQRRTSPFDTASMFMGKSTFCFVFLGEDAFHDQPVVIGQVLTHIHLPACSNCGTSLITPQLYFGPKYDSLPDELKTFADEHWPDVAGVACEGCQREEYCNNQCKEEAWEHFHQILCPAANPATSELYDLADNQGFGVSEKGLKDELWVGQYSPLVLAKIWAIIVTEAKRLMKEKGLTEPTKDIWARAKLPFRK